MVNHPRRSRAVGAPLVDLTRAERNDGTSRFHLIKDALTRRLHAMSVHGLFRTGIDKSEMWDFYLASFPEGSNPVYRKRTEHDCSCCRSFVKTMGDVVTVQDGAVVSLWDFATGDHAYDAVALAMAKLARSKPIAELFLHPNSTVGTDRSREDTPGGVRTWDHFFARLPNEVVRDGKDIGPAQSAARADHDVLLRSLREITLDAVDTVLELIAQNGLYRGEEQRRQVDAFRIHKVTFDELSAGDQDAFAWLEAAQRDGAVNRIRNSAVGTLLTDLSEGVDPDAAVRKYEAKVAPENYKRPSAVVTPAMVASAKETVESLGLTSALERRYARLTDVSVVDVLFADRDARAVMKDGVFDGLAAPRIPASRLDRVEEIPVDRFLSEVLPGARSLEVLFENRHAGDLVSLIAPTDPTAPRLFSHGNAFSWSYAGELADASTIKEKVKRAGGNVTGDLCCRLSWSNFDDLDLHMVEPNGHEIFHGSKVSVRTRGQLDVDMNVSPETREPVENIVYPDAARMAHGTYRLFVHQYTKRESVDVGFEVEVEFKGERWTFTHENAVRSNQRVDVADIVVANGVAQVVGKLPSTRRSKRLWGLDTEAFHRVGAVMLSPNHWAGAGAVGNRHLFFVVPGCVNDEGTRGFYNEYLRPELAPHRKVLEMIGSRTRVPASSEQVSGLGFSSTKRNHVVVRVGGAVTRTLRVAF